MVDDNLKEGIHNQDTFGLDGRGIQWSRHGSVETVTVERRVKHEHTSCHVFAIEHVPKESMNNGMVKCT